MREEARGVAWGRTQVAVKVSTRGNARKAGGATGRHAHALAIVLAGLSLLGLSQGILRPAAAVAPGIGPQDVSWVDQFGTSASDQVTGIALDATGIYAAGTTAGAFPGQTSAGSVDGFVRRSDPDGGIVWAIQFGTPSLDSPQAVAASDASVYVAGWTLGSFPGVASFGSMDVFVARFGANGDLLWVRQFGTSTSERATGIAVDATGIYVVGTTSGALPGQSQVGGADAFIRKYDGEGNAAWTRQFGTTASDTATAVAAGATGIYVIGFASGALPGQAQAGGFDAFIRKYDGDGSEAWTRQFGTSGTDVGWGIAVGGSAIYATGTTTETFRGERNAGGQDGFVRCVDFEGNEIWTREFGTAGSDTPRGVSVDATPGFEGVYVVGSTTGTFPGLANAGGTDAFATMYDPVGNAVWVREFGSPASDQALGVATTYSDVYAVGLTNGAFFGAASMGGQDAFLVKFALPPLEKIQLVGGKIARLVADGTLNRGEGNSLTVKLAAAATQLERGNPSPAVHILHAFENEVASLRASTRFSASEASLLIGWADNIIDQID